MGQLSNINRIIKPKGEITFSSIASEYVPNNFSEITTKF